MAVKTELVKEFLVDRIEAIVVEREREELGTELQRLMDVPLVEILDDHASQMDPAMAARLARAGYLARMAETELFAPAREQVSAWTHDLSGLSQQPESARAISARLARLEPVERPDPGDAHATTWRVPGPGGHVRHYVALAALQRLTASDADGRGEIHDAADLKRCWLYGFFARCCEEVSPAGPRAAGI